VFCLSPVATRESREGPFYRAFRISSVAAARVAVIGWPHDADIDEISFIFDRRTDGCDEAAAGVSGDSTGKDEPMRFGGAGFER